MKMPAKITQLGILTFLCTMEACQVCVSALESRVISLLVRIEPIDIQSALPKVTKDPLPPVKIVILGSYLKSSVIYETQRPLNLMELRNISHSALWERQHRYKLKHQSGRGCFHCGILVASRHPCSQRNHMCLILSPNGLRLKLTYLGVDTR